MIKYKRKSSHSKKVNSQKAKIALSGISKEFGIPRTTLRCHIEEINMNLKAILPASVFCCACIIDISFEKQLLRIWLGGLPDCFLYRYESKTIDRISSDHLPLGIVDSTDFDAEMQMMEMSINDRLLVCSDGISEAVNSEGEMFGEERIVQAIERCADGEEILGHWRFGECDILPWEIRSHSPDRGSRRRR